LDIEDDQLSKKQVILRIDPHTKALTAASIGKLNSYLKLSGSEKKIMQKGTVYTLKPGDGLELLDGKYGFIISEVKIEEKKMDSQFETKNSDAMEVESLGSHSSTPSMSISSLITNRDGSEATSQPTTAPGVSVEIQSEVVSTKETRAITACDQEETSEREAKKIKVESSTITKNTIFTFTDPPQKLRREEVDAAIALQMVNKTLWKTTKSTTLQTKSSKSNSNKKRNNSNLQRAKQTKKRW